MHLSWKSTTFFLVAIQAITVVNGGHGDPCDPSNPCDIKVGLTCKDNSCACVEPTFMVFDPARAQCVSLVGTQGNCFRQPIADIERHCTDNAECVRRPEDYIGTSPFGYCRCVADFVGNDDRVCVASRLGHGAPCDDNDPTKTCEVRSGLTCSKDGAPNVCECIAKDFMVYNAEDRRCVSLADETGNCFLEPIGGLDRPCVPYAECLPRPDTPTSPIGYCACASGFFKYADRTCGTIQSAQPFGHVCNTTHYCDVTASLLCDNSGPGPQDGNCACADPVNMLFDTETQSCRSLVNGHGRSCYVQPIGGVHRKCVRNARCEPNPDIPLHGYCVCDDGFLAYSDRTCDIPKIQGYLDTCNATHTCDRAAILDCVQAVEHCSCSYLEDAYDEDRKKCLSPLGGLCHSTPVHGQQRECPLNAKCRPLKDGAEFPLPYGVCECSDEFPNLEDGMCKAAGQVHFVCFTLLIGLTALVFQFNY